MRLTCHVGMSAMHEHHGSGRLDVPPTVSRPGDRAPCTQSLVGSTTTTIVSSGVAVSARSALARLVPHREMIRCTR